MKVFLTRLLVVLAALVGLALLAFVVVVSIGVRVDLGHLRVPAQALASTALGRDVALEGELVLVPTWSPTVEISEVRIGNPEGWTGPDFAQLQHARLTAGVVPLLRGHAVVREFSATGVDVHFERRADGQVNWLFGPSGAPEPEPEADEKAKFDLSELFIQSAEIEELALREIQVSYVDRLAGGDYVLAITELRGRMGTHEPVKIDLSGKLGSGYGELPYRASIAGGPPVDLFNGDNPWPLELDVEIAETKLVLETRVQEPLSLARDRSGPAADAAEPGGEVAQTASAEPAIPLLPPGRSFGKVDLALSGKALESLEPLIRVDLPPWGPHSLEASFEAFHGGRYTADIALGMGKSRLEGTLKAQLSDTGKPPRLDVVLTSPRVRLDDFPTEGWSALTGKAEPAQASSEDAAPRTALLDRETLRRLNGSLRVDVRRVSSGRDRLGRGRFTARLDQGRLVLNPLEIEAPGGKLALGLVFHPTSKGVVSQIAARVDNFDYGILARRVDPKSEFEGHIGLQIDLHSTAPTFADTMEHATGRFDFAVFPENMDSGGIDLWAANLVTAVLPAIDPGEGSKINCVVGLFDLENGIMRQHALGLDTSNMTVRGRATIDFRKNHLAVDLVPESKRPRLFALATPVQVEGQFDEFGLDIRPEDLLGSVVVMVTSPVHVPLRYLILAAAGGRDPSVCLSAIERQTDATPAVSAKPPSAGAQPTGQKSLFRSVEEFFRPAKPSSGRDQPESPGATSR